MNDLLVWLMDMSALEAVGLLTAVWFSLSYVVLPTAKLLRCSKSPPRVEVRLSKEEQHDRLEGCPKFDPNKLKVFTTHFAQPTVNSLRPANQMFTSQTLCPYYALGFTKRTIQSH